MRWRLSGLLVPSDPIKRRSVKRLAMPSSHTARWYQAIILLFFLGLTYLSFAFVGRVAHGKSVENFQILVEESLTSIDQRFEVYSRILDGVAGLVLASEPVNRVEMAQYAQALKVGDTAFVFDAIGFATGAQRGEFVVRYIEPLANHADLVGVDLASNAELLRVARQARDTGETLLARGFGDAAAEGAQKRAVLLKPIYRAGPVASGIAGQGGGFVGFAFAVLNVKGAFEHLTTAQGRLVDLDVGFDGAAQSRAAGLSASAAGPDYTAHKSIEKMGQSIALAWNSTPLFDGMQPFRARWIVLCLGLLVTGLVSAIVAVLFRINQTITATVAQKTQDLETQHEEKRSILENVMLAIISADESGRIIDSNDAALKMLLPQGGQGDLDGALLSDLLPDLDLEGDAGWRKVRIPSRAANVRPTILEVETKAWVTAAGEARITLLMRDITVSEGHAQQIAEAEQRWNLALMGAQIGVFDVDLRKNISVVSEAWLENMHLDALPDRRDPYREQMRRMHPDDLAEFEAIEADCINGRTERAVAHFRVKGGDDAWRWIKSDAVVAERAPDGTALRMLGIQTDVTESIRLKQMKRDFVATISHELRTPLTSIKGALGLLQAQLQSGKQVSNDRLIEIASSNSDKLLSLVNDILDMEKMNSGKMDIKMTPVSLDEIMTQASSQFETFASQWGVTVDAVGHDAAKEIWTDKKRVIQVITNLLSNACKYANPGTAVRLSAERLETHTKISVSNWGPGIPEEFRSRIFQPFSQADSSDTRKRGGTGLGLSISRKLIEAMGGTVGFESEPGKQTVFWFTCPLTEPTVEPEPVADGAAKIVRVA
jgi:signal transduction histidine kinase/CHASE1-domain containing sensor protein